MIFSLNFYLYFIFNKIQIIYIIPNIIQNHIKNANNIYNIPINIIIIYLYIKTI